MDDGERNSKYFHSNVQDWRRKLYIHHVQDDNGDWVSNRLGISAQVIRLFHTLFFADCGPFDLSRLDYVTSLVSYEDNEVLCQIPEKEEIKDAVFHLDTDSAAGPDGFSEAIYQAAWEVIKGDSIAMVQSFFLGRDLHRSLTHTAIIFLPKKPSPSFADYRPISLCNFSKKIISKVMVSRLAAVLPRLLSPHWSGFVAGRSIMNNVLLAQEMCHGITLSNEDVVLMLDIAKAYDCLSWFFLISIM